MLPDPIKVNSKSAIRFKAQLQDFVPNATGNFVKFKVRFNLNNKMFLESKPITLSFT